MNENKWKEHDLRIYLIWHAMEKDVKIHERFIQMVKHMIETVNEKI